MSDPDRPATDAGAFSGGIDGKQAKYATRNPLSRHLVGRFLETIDSLVTRADPASVLDVGCGEGMVLEHLQRRLEGRDCAAIDLDPVRVAHAARNLSWCRVGVGSAYEIPYDANRFELVMCCEVLEHLERPHDALAELARVSSKFVILSVPREPIWRMLNLARGAYWSQWGNTPGHLNHWSARSFESFAASKARVLERRNSLPWTAVFGTVT